MKITCQKSDLLKGVNIVSKAVPTRTTMAILECILLDATNGDIRLTANDTELGIETIVPGSISEQGVVALDARIFSEIVKRLPDNDVTITNDANFKTVITCEDAIYNIVGKSGDDFSYIPNITRNDPIAISQFTLNNIIKQTIFCTADTENNKSLTGELFEVKNNILKVVALDGHRVAIRHVELKNNTRDVRVIVPKKPLNELTKIMDGGIDSEVLIYVTDNHIIFEFEDTTMVSRLIDGEFLSVENMLNLPHNAKVTVNKKKLINCIDRASLLVKEGDHKAIIFDIKDNVLALNMTSFFGSFDEKIEISKEGEDLKIGFNPKFFLDALKVVEGEYITFYTTNSRQPCFIKDEEMSYVYIVLPINFSAPGAY